MSNTCITEFQITGTNEAIHKIVDLLHQHEKETSFSSGTPVEEILEEFGIEAEDGYSLDAEWSLGVVADYDGWSSLRVVEESAWETTQTMRWLTDHVEGIHSYVFYTEEPGEGIYATNDKTGETFPARYKAVWEDKGKNEIEEVFAKTKQELVDAINAKRGTHYPKFCSLQRVHSVFITEIEVWDDIDG